MIEIEPTTAFYDVVQTSKARLNVENRETYLRHIKECLAHANMWGDWLPVETIMSFVSVIYDAAEFLAGKYIPNKSDSKLEDIMEEAVCEMIDVISSPELFLDETPRARLEKFWDEYQSPYYYGGYREN